MSRRSTKDGESWSIKSQIFTKISSTADWLAPKFRWSHILWRSIFLARYIPVSVFHSRRRAEHVNNIHLPLLFEFKLSINTSAVNFSDQLQWVSVRQWHTVEHRCSKNKKSNIVMGISKRWNQFFHYYKYNIPFHLCNAKKQKLPSLSISHYSTLAKFHLGVVMSAHSQNKNRICIQFQCVERLHS